MSVLNKFLKEINYLDIGINVFNDSRQIVKKILNEVSYPNEFRKSLKEVLDLIVIKFRQIDTNSIENKMLKNYYWDLYHYLKAFYCISLQENLKRKIKSINSKEKILEYISDVLIKLGDNVDRNTEITLTTAQIIKEFEDKLDILIRKKEIYILNNKNIDNNLVLKDIENIPKLQTDNNNKNKRKIKEKKEEFKEMLNIEE
ncbi:MAG: hypothetical protein ACTSRZ_15690 [Promethearchaeota archaeon]